MSYETAVARMFALGHELAQTPSHKFDLAHMRVLLGALGNPERRFPTVLIAGTNGKGSTAATLASILQAAGLRTALYTSPHLVRINERFRLGAAGGGRLVADDELSAALADVPRWKARLRDAWILHVKDESEIALFAILDALLIEHPAALPAALWRGRA